MHKLSAREREVLEHVALGETSTQIGIALGIRRNTVEAHVSNIRDKLQVHNRLQAVAFVGGHIDRPAYPSKG